MSHFLKKIKQRYFTRNGETLYFGALKRIVFIFFLLLFFLGVGVLTWIKFIQKQGGKIKVPKITGMNLLTASEIVQKRKLSLKIIPVIKNKVPRYTIVQQNPAAGTTVKENRIIEIVVSSGQIFSRMPSFINKPLFKTKQLFMGQKQIKGMGRVILRRITYAPSDKPINTIVAQTPEPGSAINKDVPVSLVVSNGINYKKITLPNYSGTYFNKAVKELKFQDLFVVLKSTGTSADKIGRVVSQTPSAGARLSPGDKVTLEVGADSNGKVPVKAKVISYIVPKTNQRENEVKIVFSDSGNDSILFEGNLTAGQKIIRAVMVRGSARYKVFLNKKAVIDETF